jgi:uncharacterized membrane protein YciS (DUF1049 family)
MEWYYIALIVIGGLLYLAHFILLVYFLTQYLKGSKYVSLNRHEIRIVSAWAILTMIGPPVGWSIFALLYLLIVCENKREERLKARRERNRQAIENWMKAESEKKGEKPMKKLIGAIVNYIMLSVAIFSGVTAIVLNAIILDNVNGTTETNGEQVVFYQDGQPVTPEDLYDFYEDNQDIMPLIAAETDYLYKEFYIKIDNTNTYEIYARQINWTYRRYVDGVEVEDVIFSGDTTKSEILAAIGSDIYKFTHVEVGQ